MGGKGFLDVVPVLVTWVSFSEAYCTLISSWGALTTGAPGLGPHL